MSMSIDKRQVMSHKKLLELSKSKFEELKDVLIVLQFFNKGNNVRKVLDPFISRGCKNIILFADGCIDNTVDIAHSILRGPEHYVICANDRHEIANYRLSLRIAEEHGCRYCLLLQDDDIYEESIINWIYGALDIMSDGTVAIVGGNGGENICRGFSYRPGDNDLTNDEYVMYQNESGIIVGGLSNYHMFEISPIRPSRDAGNFGDVACVNRSPQLVSVEIALRCGFFPKALEPYQYDDYFNCFNSILHGYRIIHAPFAGKSTNPAIGGMRVYNDVNVRKRPEHFAGNWSFIFDLFGDDLNNGKLIESIFRNQRIITRF